VKCKRALPFAGELKRSFEFSRRVRLHPIVPIGKTEHFPHLGVVRLGFTSQASFGQRSVELAGMNQRQNHHCGTGEGVQFH
jgi:hypothetical protein